MPQVPVPMTKTEKTDEHKRTVPLCCSESIDYFAMMRGWELARSDVGKT